LGSCRAEQGFVDGANAGKDAIPRRISLKILSRTSASLCCYGELPVFDEGGFTDKRRQVFSGRLAAALMSFGDSFLPTSIVGLCLSV
jgi:hypothetical protein